MPEYTSADIRNITLIGHAGSGKTSIAEVLLKNAGTIHQVGLVENGTTVSDFTDEEKERGHSIFNSVLHCHYRDTCINMIDTPGYADFAGQSLGALPAIETAFVVINASTGIESNTRRVMQRAAEYNLCRIIVINRMDVDNLDLPGLVSQIQEEFGRACLPINLPTGGGNAVVDVFNKTEGEVDFGSVEEAHTAIVEQVVEVDETLMETYLEQGEVQAGQLSGPFKKALCEGHLVPICFTCARRHDNPETAVGVKELLNLIGELLPSPQEGNQRTFIKSDADNGEVQIQAEGDSSVLAHTFQVVSDPFVGKLCTFRVHQGMLKGSSQVHVANPHPGEGNRPFRIGHVFKLSGREHVEVESVVAGDIAAVAKIEQLHFDSAVTDDSRYDGVRLETLPLPEPMYGLAVTAKSRGDEQKIGDAMSKIDAEDPSFKVTRDAVTKETVIHGLGELHLRVVLDKLKNRYKVEVDTQPPKIAYRETIRAKADGHYRHKKQSGGAGQFGEVYLRVEPLDRGAGFEFANDIFGGSIPTQYIPAVEKGIRQVLIEGAIAGYPVQDIKVTVYDGKHHPVDSKEVAFVTASRRAFLDAVHKAKPVLLEPNVNVEVTVPSTNMGDITSDLSGKRGRIQGTDMLAGDMAVIKAQVPLSEVSNYQNQLKAVTGGQGSYTVDFANYAVVPPNIQQQVGAQDKPKAEED